ncbi:hypothetical protein D4764_06G0007220 [Takifugu flavidus]|uniref:Uncharacterized protein n=1 Tax=Takifugu flavidus TaxID=433684 RepID=A0A5C6MVF0_9TELE|nr:hypothetical protein D4764_06G0007220 [Takifugu flavidus]
MNFDLAIWETVKNNGEQGLCQHPMELEGEDEGDPPADGRLGKERGEGGGQVEDRVGRRGEEKKSEGEVEERGRRRRRRRRGKRRGRERRGEERRGEERRGEG